MAVTKEQAYLTGVSCEIDVPSNLRENLVFNEVTLTESLLTPGLQTSIKIINKVHEDFEKDLSGFYNRNVDIKAERKILEEYNLPKSFLKTRQKIYRLSNRRRLNYNLEEFELSACDESLIKDLRTYVSRSWNCETPSNVVEDILNNCIQPEHMEVETSNPPRDFIAENIHPFQAISKQAEVASASVGDINPTFLHFMTFQDSGHRDIPTHNFRSLAKMVEQAPVATFTYSAKIAVDLNYANPFDVMEFSFPCDFDMLSDLLNHYDEQGNPFSSLVVHNPQLGAISVYGAGETACGATPFQSVSNLGSETDQGGCTLDVQRHLLRRKARMVMLDQDKVALRFTVPFNPNLNVGRVIRFQTFNPRNGKLNYGSGDYLISSMTHRLLLGGMGTTTLDCVTNTVGAAGVRISV